MYHFISRSNATFYPAGVGNVKVKVKLSIRIS